MVGILTGPTPAIHSGPGNNGNEGILHIAPCSRTGTTPSDGLVSYLIHSLDEGRVLRFCRDTISVFYSLFVRLLGFYGISTFVGYLMLNLFLYKKKIQFQTIQFSISTQFVENISISSNSA